MTKTNSAVIKAVEKAIRWNHDLIFERVCEDGIIYYPTCKVDDAKKVYKGFTNPEFLFIGTTEHLAKELNIA